MTKSFHPRLSQLSAYFEADPRRGAEELILWHGDDAYEEALRQALNEIQSRELYWLEVASAVREISSAPEVGKSCKIHYSGADHWLKREIWLTLMSISQEVGSILDYQVTAYGRHNLNVYCNRIRYLLPDDEMLVAKTNALMSAFDKVAECIGTLDPASVDAPPGAKQVVKLLLDLKDFSFNLANRHIGAPS